MAGWVKVLLTGDAAELGTATPLAVATAGGAGTGAAASKEDHTHSVGTGAINASVMFAADVVDNASIGDDAVRGPQISGTATDITVAQLIFTPAASATGTAEGTMFYDSDDNHVYVYVV